MGAFIPSAPGSLSRCAEIPVGLNSHRSFVSFFCHLLQLLWPSFDSHQSVSSFSGQYRIPDYYWETYCNVLVEGQKQ